jgi:hypothetical protein
MGDFTGFWFNGVHSSELGITRVSGGDRYKEELSPEINDISVEIPGMDGEYYFGSQFGTRQFSIEIAYDSMTEKQFRKISRIFHQKTIGELIFDERPYKKYLVKIESPIELSYVCFDEPKKVEVNFNGIYGPTTVWEETDGTERIYKGEGSIEFVAYYPFAKSTKKALDSADMSSDWAISSGILSTNEKNKFYIDTIITERTEIEDTELVYEVPDGASCIIPLYNPGDFQTGFVLYVPYADGVNTYQVELTLSDGLGSLSTSEFTINTEDTSNEIGFIVNSGNGLIEGVNSFNEGEWTTSGKIYNKYINNGTFFKIPMTEEISDTELPLTLIIKIVGQAPSELEIAYYYLYL